VASDIHGGLAQINGEDDHVHLQATYTPKIAVSARPNSHKRVSALRLSPESGLVT
jgi:REP element-mobilizing transposase RayT